MSLNQHGNQEEGISKKQHDEHPIQSLMDLYKSNGELLESEKIAILNILILLLIFSVGCFIGSAILSPLLGLMKGNKNNLASKISQREMNYEFVTQKLFENMRLWNSKDHILFAGTSLDIDEEQLVHLERNIETIGEDHADRTQIIEFREKLPKETIFFKYFISESRPVKISGSKTLPRKEWKCFKSGFHYTFIENLKKQEFFIVTQKSLHGKDQIKTQITSNVFPLLGQMSEEFPFKHHIETDVADQSQIRDSVVSNLNNIKNQKYENNDQPILLADEFERIASNQAIIDDLISGSGFQIENAIQNPKLSFIWKRTTWDNQMNHYNNYERLRTNYKPGGFILPYQKIANQNFKKWLFKNVPFQPNIVRNSLHFRSISMRLSYSDEILLNNFVLPIYQTNKEAIYIQIKGKTKFILFSPFNAVCLKPKLSVVDWKYENDWKDGQTVISSIDPFNIVENVKGKNNFLKNSIAISVEVDEHEILYIPSFWWVLEMGIHPTTEENFNLVLREEFEPHHSTYELLMNGLLKSAPEQGDEWKNVEHQKRPIKLQ